MGETLFNGIKAGPYGSSGARAPGVTASGVIARLVELSDGDCRVETWVEGKWVPDGATVTAVLHATPVLDPSTT
jgi:hypothetical protein